MSGRTRGNGVKGAPDAAFLEGRELAYEKRLADGVAAENGPKNCSSEAVAPAAG